MKTTPLALVGAVAAAGLLMSAPVSAGKKDDTLNVVLPRDVQTLDNMYSTRRESHIVTKMIDDMLFYLDPVSGNPVPNLAKSHKFTNDSTLDIELHRGIKFHDGSELKAEDVAYSLNFQRSKKSKAKRRKRFAFWLKNVEVMGPYTVRLNMVRPYTLALYDLANYSRIRKKGTYDDPKAPDGVNTAAQQMAVNGLGPYKVVSFQPRKKLILERFEGYRKDGPKGIPAIKRVTVRTVPDFGTQAAELMAGSADWAYNVPTDVAMDVAASGRARHIAGPSMRVAFLVLDASGSAEPNGPLTKLKVRQAMNHAIDKTSIVNNLVKGKAQVIHAACNPVQFACTQDVKTYAYDPAKAKKLLADAGYPNGFPLVLWAYRERPVGEAIINQLKQIGIDVSLRYVKGSTLAKARKKDEVVAYHATTGSGSIAHTGAIVPSYFGPRTIHKYAQHDKKLSDLVVKATSSYDEEVQKSNFRLALKRIADQAYWVPIYKYSLNYLASNELDFDPPSDGMPRLFLAKWK